MKIKKNNFQQMLHKLQRFGFFSFSLHMVYCAHEHVPCQSASPSVAIVAGDLRENKPAYGW